jgi:hypothetical protein
MLRDFGVRRTEAAANRYTLARRNAVMGRRERWVLPMSILRWASALAALASLTAASAPAAEERPTLTPTRDADIIYRITRAGQPAIIERRRWLAADHLERVDGPDKSTTIFDADRSEITLLNPGNRTYRKLEGAPRRPADPAKDATLARGAEAVVAGLHCTDWSWVEDVETHTVCLTPDGVLLRLVIDGKTVIEAISVAYKQQPAKLFQVPPNYSPALAPEGAAGE